MARRRLTVEPATEAHAAQLAQHLRPEDVAEMKASYGREPFEGLQRALQLSTTAKTILDGTRVVAISGVAPFELDNGVASIWLLTSRLANRFPVAFMRVASEELPRLTEGWRVLFNMVWTENRRALRWVRAMGFDVLPAVPYGVSGLLFHPIRWIRSS